MEILLLLALAVVVFLGIRMFMQRQAQKMNERLQEEITPDTARKAALSLTDEQHKTLYRAIAAEDGKQALAFFKQSTGASVRDCIVAVQALHKYPQPSPSEIQFEQGFNLNNDDDDDVDEEYLEDAIDEVRDQTSEDSPVAEADPNTGQILGENTEQVPDIPGGDEPVRDEPEEDEIEARARELLAESGFDPEEELTVPDEWATGEEDEPHGFHLEVQRGEEKITLSHEDLEPWVHDQLYALLRDDFVEQAASLLAANSPLTEDEAHKFLVVFKNQS